jgi:[ribosomal protein S5]-alanine N-acetyltransferase
MAMTIPRVLYESHHESGLAIGRALSSGALGYCTEAVGRIIPFIDEHLNTTKIVARCLVRNQASARVMEKAGLRKEGHLSKHVLQNGNYEDVLLYGLALPQLHDEA